MSKIKSLEDYRKAPKHFSLYRTCYPNKHDSKKSTARIIKNMKKWEKQRYKRGFDDTELWGLDYTIASFILPRLIAFREMGKNGMPTYYETAIRLGFKDKEDFPNHFDLTDEENELLEQVATRDYDEILDKIINAFYYFLEDPASRLHDYMSDANIDEWLNDPNEYIEKNSLQEHHKSWCEAMDKQQAAIDEGMDLFRKYFFSLWD